MPMINTRADRDLNDELLARGVADFGVEMIKGLTERRLNDDRTIVENRIKEAGTFQDALSVIENAPFKVKNTFGDELMERARQRFPEQELISVLDQEGGVRRISQEKGRPLTDAQIEEQGFLPASQHLIVSTDRKTGEIEIHDVSLGMRAAGEELERLQAMFPDRDFQVSQAPETETFMAIRNQQLQAKEIAGRRQSSNDLTVDEMKFYANVQAEMQNDPLYTRNGAIVIESAREDIVNRFKDFNGKFAAGVFSLDNPESAALVQNGIAITQAAVGRGLSVEKAMDLGFNSQIANNVVKNLLEGNTLDNGVKNETQRRFGVPPQTLISVIQAVTNLPDFQQLQEFTPTDPDILAIPVGDGKTLIQFVKVNGRLVPYGHRNR